MAITLLNMDGFSKFRNWQTAKNQENPSQLISITYICPWHALELKEYFGKLAISQKTRRDIKMLSKGPFIKMKI